MEECPHLNLVDKCVYLSREGACEDTEICPGNGDAWCFEDTWWDKEEY